MKKSLIFIFFPLSLLSQNTLIFSEYGEGSSFNKWIEIYNPTFDDIALDEYSYNFCFNGCDSLQWEYSIAFDSGYILLPEAIYLLVHYNADSILLSQANQKTNLMSNGNDVIALIHKTSNSIIDIIGQLDSADNINGWQVDGFLDATKDHTLIRKSDICEGNLGNWLLSDGSSLDPEWIVSFKDDFSNVNIHNSNCLSSNSINELFFKNKRLVEIRNILGKKTKNITNQPLFYLYDDGTVEKRLFIK